MKKKLYPHPPMSLLTDLYELTMTASYFSCGKNGLASFDLFIRNMPARRSFFVSAGLNDVVEFLEGFHFPREAIQYLRSLKIFSNDFLRFLSKLRFRGDLWAVPEGTIVFPNEPILRVVAPIIEAQLVESFLLNAINLQTTIASKAARVVLAAKGRGVFDFSLRRTHGIDAALKVARSSYLSGFQGTSNCLAGKLYDIPVAGTMAHSFVMAFDEELESFRAYVEAFPERAILLVDTYETLRGVKNAIIVAQELKRKNKKLRGIRLDSGDLAALAQKARALLDKAGLSYVNILASGNLDEYQIEKLIRRKAPIDGFGVGTKMGTSDDAPYCDVIYKLSEMTDQKGKFHPTMKLSEGKFTLPGRKQIFRLAGKKGEFKKDIIGLEKEPLMGQPLLIKVMHNGGVIYKRPSLRESREFTRRQLSQLPAGVTALFRAQPYPVKISPRLKMLTASVSKNILSKIK